MLEQVQAFKERLVIALITGKPDEELEIEVNEFLIVHKYQILDILDDALYRG